MHRPQHVSTRHYSPRSQATGLLELQCCLLVHQRSSRGSKTLAFFGEYGSLLLLPPNFFLPFVFVFVFAFEFVFSASLPPIPSPFLRFVSCMYVCAHTCLLRSALLLLLCSTCFGTKKRWGAHQSPGRNLLCQGGCKAPIVGWMYPSLICLALHTHPHTLICV